MSWEDDWPAFGVREGMTDVAIASRSIATADLRDALLRLTEVARRRVCITLATGSSPRVDERILAAVGLPSVLGRDYLYAFNILADEGIKGRGALHRQHPRRYVRHPRGRLREASRHDRRLRGRARFRRASAQQARANLREWLTANLVPNETAGAPDRKGVIQLAWRLAEPRTVTWAFLAWNTH